eukprot:TCALIF_09199-PA protein Name:"Similar to psma7 Proteasome subunit alpha type-7 (Carassius auratus)" AED:0.42 eAED:0.42 QI:0/0/0/0.66/0/0/3/0/103
MNPSIALSIYIYLGVKQKCTQSSGRRPFGISCLLTGFDYDGTPHLYQTDPAGMYSEWKANAIGRRAKTNYNAEVATNVDTIRLGVVQPSSTIDKHVMVIEKEK